MKSPCHGAARGLVYRMKKNPVIAVHDGAFHADDVFAVAVLKIIHENAHVIRTRDPELLEKADFRVDVGGKNNPGTGDFDHHQMEDVGARENGIPFASVGLVWKHFGAAVSGSEKNSEAIDQRLIQQIDANDNGYSLDYDSTEISPYTVSRVVEAFNPVWDDQVQDYDTGFQRALDVAGGILRNEIRRVRGRAKARQLILDALATYSGSPYIILDQAMPWQDYVVDQSDALYVLYPNHTGDWRVRAVPVAKGSFDLRKPLPASWAGKRDEELVDATGVQDAVFCHKQRFMAVAKSREGAESLVIRALNED